MLRLAIVLAMALQTGTAWGCKASWYGEAFEGKQTACLTIFRRAEPTAAHPTLPCGTTVWVRAKESGRSVRVTITDRGPFKKGRCIDLSESSFILLAPKGKGVIEVDIRPTVVD